MSEEKITFKCGKCEHEITLGLAQSYRRFILNVEKLTNLNCPECGEKGDCNWIFVCVDY